MKKFFAITVVLMIISISLGCASVPETTQNPSAGKDSLVTSVGSKQFVGEYQKGTLDLNGWNPRGGR